jgi:dihydropteroate synthase
MSETPANLVDVTGLSGGQEVLADCLIRPLGIVHGPIAEIVVENGIGEWLAGGPAAYTSVDMAASPAIGGERELRTIRQVSLMRAPAVVARMRLLADPRPPIAGLTWVRPRIMSFVNLVSARGEAGERSTKGAVQRGRLLAMRGADILAITASDADLGDMEEVDRVAPVIEQLAEQGFRVAIASRRPMVMRAAARAGARLVIDASPALDDDTLYTLGDIGLPVILRRSGHIGAHPASWPEALDLAAAVHTALESRIEMLEGAGLARDRVIVDPGMAVGHPTDENIALLHAVSLFHGLGCPLMVDCESFVPARTQTSRAGWVRPGPIEVALSAVSQGVHLLAANEPADIWSAAASFRAISAASFDDAR